MKTKALLLFCVIFFNSIGQAAWKNSGSLQPYFRQYAFAPGSQTSNQNEGVSVNWKVDWKIHREWRLRSDLELITDSDSHDPGDRFQGNARNLYVENKSSSITLRVGYQTLVPEGPDILNPAEIIHVKNWTLPIEAKTLSSAGVSLSQELDVWQWEFFWIPQQAQPKLPGKNSAWWPRERRLPIESEDTEIRLPSGVHYEFTDSEELNQALRNNWVFRLQRKSENWESQLLYTEGLSPDPFLLTDLSATLISLSPKTILLVDSPVRLRPLYFRRQAVAGTFLLPVGSWAIKGGANWSKPLGSDPRLPGENSTAVLGVEKNVETKWGVVTWILQHEEQKKLDKNQISFLRSIFENAWSLGWRIPFGEEAQVLGGVIYDTVGKSSIYRLNGSRRLNDFWSLSLGGTWLEGPEETLPGLYNKYDSWNVELSYHF